MEKREFKQYSAQWTYSPTDSVGLHSTVCTEIKFFKNDHYMYSKVKKTFFARPPSEEYNGGQFTLLEWFDIDNKIYLIFNEENGEISVYDAESGEKINTIDSNTSSGYISEYKLFDDREYLYVSGWSWWPEPNRDIYHIPTMLHQSDYSPTSISCIDNERNYDNIINPGIKLFGCSSCKEFLEKHESIFEEIYIDSQTKLFNNNRSQDILLKHFIERKDVVEFHCGAESLLKSMLESGDNKPDRKRFYIYSYDNGVRKGYDQSLYSKISDPLNAGYYDNTNFNHILAATIFNFVDALGFDKINLSFEIYSDLGNLNISMTHTMLPCDRLKKMDTNVSWRDEPRYKIDITSPIKITCSLSKN